jgi:hypothetical protein
MSINVRQQVTIDDPSAGSSISLAITVLAGSSIHVIGGCGNADNIAASNPLTATVPGGAPAFTPTLLDNVLDSVNSQRLAHWAEDGLAAGTYTLTLTFAASSATYRSLTIKEIAETNGYDAAATAAHAAQNQASPGTGVGGVSSGNTSSLSAQPILISAVSQDVQNGVAPAVHTAAGFASDTPGGQTLMGYGGAAGGASASRRVTSTAALAGTFTAANNVAHITVAAVFLEAAASGDATAPGATATATAIALPGQAEAIFPGDLFIFGDTASNESSMGGLNLFGGFPGTDATASGITVSAGASLLAGGAAAASAAAGQTLQAVASAITGAVTAASAASGQTLAATASLLVGQASASSQVAGSTLVATVSVLPGSAAAASAASGQTIAASTEVVVGAVTASSQAAGATLTATATLIAGSASGTGEGQAAGQTLTASGSLLPGAAAASSAASGVALAAAVSLIAGAASADSQAAGAALAATAGALLGSAEASSLAPGQTLTASVSLIAGSAGGTGNATASGVTLAVTAALIAGNAAADAVAAGQVLAAAVSLAPGPAAGHSAAAGQIVVASASLAIGAVAADAVAPGQTLLAAVSLIVGVAGSNVFVVGNPYVERVRARSRVWTITKDLIMSLEKRTWEERLFDFDLSGLLAPSVTLASVSAMVAEPADGATPIAFGTPAINSQPVSYPYATVPAGKVVQCRVSGGVERSYILRARCMDSNGEHVEGTVRLNVRDRP